MSDGPVCAHLHVEWTTEDAGRGSVRGWWECTLCKTKFMPTPLHEFLLAEARARTAAVIAVVQKHYPAIAGRVIMLQEANEDNAAQKWGEIARVFYSLTFTDTERDALAEQLLIARIDELNRIPKSAYWQHGLERYLLRRRDELSQPQPKESTT